MSGINKTTSSVGRKRRQRVVAVAAVVVVVGAVVLVALARRDPVGSAVADHQAVLRQEAAHLLTQVASNGSRVVDFDAEVSRSPEFGEVAADTGITAIIVVDSEVRYIINGPSDGDYHYDDVEIWYTTSAPNPVPKCREATARPVALDLYVVTSNDCGRLSGPVVYFIGIAFVAACSIVVAVVLYLVSLAAWKRLRRPTPD